MPRRIPLLLCAALLLASCRERAAETPGAPVKSPAPSAGLSPAPSVVVTPTAPPSAAAARTASAALEGARPSTGAPSREALIGHYLEDCGYTALLSIDDPDAASGISDKPECEAMAWEQNCAPDLFGCWDKLMDCKAACKVPCGSCQAKAASACNKCKAACKTGPSCLRACAEARVDAREGCLEAADACRGKACPAAEAKCMSEGEAKVKKVCGKDCERYKSCASELMNKGTFEYDLCKKQFSQLPADCFTWCDPGM